MTRGVKKVLNVGGGTKDIALPPIYDGWEHVLLDIDAAFRPDILCDARELTRLPAAQFDAVYCSHNLEHYYRHEVFPVLAGFRHVLKAEGFAHIRVPDLGAVMRQVVAQSLDIEDVLYQAPSGPITVRDVLYGYASEIEKRNVDFYAHKTGFTEKSLTAALLGSGYHFVFTAPNNLEILAYAFTHQPTPDTVALLHIPDTRSAS